MVILVEFYAGYDGCSHYYSAPAGGVALILVLVAMPPGFPYPAVRKFSSKVLSNELLSRIDYYGFAMLLVACAFLIVALEESGIQYAWSDPLPITFLVLSGLLWIAFLAWERFVSRKEGSVEPIFTWRFIKNRVFLGVLL